MIWKMISPNSSWMDVKKIVAKEIEKFPRNTLIAIKELYKIRSILE